MAGYGVDQQFLTPQAFVDSDELQRLPGTICKTLFDLLPRRSTSAAEGPDIGGAGVVSDAFHCGRPNRALAPSEMLADLPERKPALRRGTGHAGRAGTRRLAAQPQRFVLQLDRLGPLVLDTEVSFQDSDLLVK